MCMCVQSGAQKGGRGLRICLEEGVGTRVIWGLGLGFGDDICSLR